MLVCPVCWNSDYINTDQSGQYPHICMQCGWNGNHWDLVDDFRAAIKYAQNVSIYKRSNNNGET